MFTRFLTKSVLSSENTAFTDSRGAGLGETPDTECR